MPAWRYVLDCVREFRERDADTPVVLMGYLNPIEIRGAERFAQEAVAAGVDGVLLVDLPPEEAGEFRDAFAAHGLALILLAAPTTSDERLALLCDRRAGLPLLRQLRRRHRRRPARYRRRGRPPARHPRPQPASRSLAGFGIKDAASAAAMAREADGVVVGSALVAALARRQPIRPRRPRDVPGAAARRAGRARQRPLPAQPRPATSPRRCG